MAYLYGIMAHLEYNNMFHAKVLLHKVHALRSRIISICVVMRAVQPLQHVPLEVSQEVCLVAQVIRSLLQLKVLANIDCPLPSSRDIIDVAIVRSDPQSAGRYIYTYHLLGERIREVLSLKCTPTVPSVKA